MDIVTISKKYTVPLEQKILEVYDRKRYTPAFNTVYDCHGYIASNIIGVIVNTLL
jgi:hypothetical protein